MASSKTCDKLRLYQMPDLGDQTRAFVDRNFSTWSSEPMPLVSPLILTPQAPLVSLPLSSRVRLQVTLGLHSVCQLGVFLLRGSLGIGQTSLDLLDHQCLSCVAPSSHRALPRPPFCHCSPPPGCTTAGLAAAGPATAESADAHRGRVDDDDLGVINFLPKT